MSSDKRFIYAALVLFAFVLLLRGCGRHTVQTVAAAPAYQEPVYAADPAPVVVQQPASVVVHDNSDSGFFSGLVAGHLMSHHSAPVHHHTTIVNRHYNSSTRVTKKVYRAPRRSRSAYRSRSRRR